jgi:hypothetical protein
MRPPSLAGFVNVDAARGAVDVVWVLRRGLPSRALQHDLLRA